MYSYKGVFYNSSAVKSEDKANIGKENSPNRNEQLDASSYFTDEYVTINYKNQNDDDEDLKRYNDECLSIVLKGQIYNSYELQHNLLSNEDDLLLHTDVQIIAALFKKQKEQVFHYLRGMFSIIIWDKKEKTMYGARDHFGIKALFYQETEYGLIFASDKRYLTTMLEEEEINTEALQRYLSFQYVPEPLTMTSGIKKLEPGKYFIKKLGESIKITDYWYATFNPVLMEKKEWMKRIQTVLYDSVRAHMRSNVPIGSFLSGGIDSTIIVAIAKKIYPNLKTFSVGFERDGFSEVDVAKETANELGIENISATVSPEEYVDALPFIMWHMGDPLADPSCIPLYFCGKLAKEHVGIVLSGEGADELFGGYNIYHEPDSLKVFHSIPSLVKKMVAKVADVIPEGVKGKSFLQRGVTPLRERYIGNAKMFENEEKKSILKHYNKNQRYQQVTSDLFDYAEDYPLVNQMQYIDIHTWVRGNILLKAERMSAANSIEMRVPFLDKEVFQVANEIPVELKIANGTTKSILREASRGIIPEHVLDRRKLGFPVPLRHWLKEELNGWAKQLIEESQTEHLLYKSYVLDLLEAHCRDKGDYSRKIWTVLMFMLWHQIFIEKKYNFEDDQNQDNKINKTSQLVSV